jgi:hypothetical protein
MVIMRHRTPPGRKEANRGNYCEGSQQVHRLSFPKASQIGRSLRHKYYAATDQLQGQGKKKKKKKGKKVKNLNKNKKKERLSHGPAMRRG